MRCWVGAAHALDLGIYQVTHASAIVELVAEDVWPGANVRDRFTAAHHDYAAWCRRAGCQPAPRFKAEQFRSGDYVCLSQIMCKGVATKHMLFWLYEVTTRPAVCATPHGALRAALFANFSMCEIVMFRNGRFLPAGELALLQQSAEAGLACYNALSIEAGVGNAKTWHIIPKIHMVTHLFYDQACQANPRATIEYPDEDMVGRVKRIACRCHGRTICTMCLRRYVILIGTRCWSRLQELRGL